MNPTSPILLQSLNDTHDQRHSRHLLLFTCKSRRNTYLCSGNTGVPEHKLNEIRKIVEICGTIQTII